MIDESQRLALRELIDGKANQPDTQYAAEPTTLGDISIDRELIEVFNRVKRILIEVETDSSIPANQRAAVAATAVNTLSQITRTAEALEREKRFKLMESCLVDSLKTLPNDARELFFTEYERLARAAGLLGDE